MKAFNWGRAGPGAPETHLYLSDDRVVAVDVQTAKENQQTLDNVKEHRDRGRPKTKHGTRFAAQIPITLWVNWKEEFRAGPCMDWTWREYVAMKLNSQEYHRFRAWNRIQGKR